MESLIKFINSKWENNLTHQQQKQQQQNKKEK